MEVGIHANETDTSTSHVAKVLHLPLKELSRRLCGDYGGEMQHLWIDVELVEMLARTDGRPRFPFRFQKRVSGRSHFGLPRLPDKFNVGHYSVRPDFEMIRTLQGSALVQYTLNLLFESTSTLGVKRKRVGHFDAAQFAQTFGMACREMGFEVGHAAH